MRCQACVPMCMLEGVSGAAGGPGGSRAGARRGTAGKALARDVLHQPLHAPPHVGICGGWVGGVWGVGWRVWGGGGGGTQPGFREASARGPPRGPPSTAGRSHAVRAARTRIGAQPCPCFPRQPSFMRTNVHHCTDQLAARCRAGPYRPPGLRSAVRGTRPPRDRSRGCTKPAGTAGRGPAFCRQACSACSLKRGPPWCRPQPLPHPCRPGRGPGPSACTPSAAACAGLRSARWLQGGGAHGLGRASAEGH